MSDQWEVYLCRVDDEPASILFDVGIRKQAPVAGVDWVGWLRLQMNAPRPDGMPSNEEYETLIEIDDSITAAIEEASCEVAYVGTNTSGGKRDFFFYSNDQASLEALLAQAMASHPTYEYEIGGREDAEWSIYLGFLYPDSRTWQTIMDRRVLEALMKDGDDGTSPRDVHHWAYFPDDGARQSFIKKVVADGYAVDSQSSSEESELPYCVVLSRNHPVDTANIYEYSLMLHDLAIDLGGNYDGWETPIVKGE